MWKIALSCVLTGLLFATSQVLAEADTANSDDNRVFVEFGRVNVHMQSILSYKITNDGKEPIHFLKATIYGANFQANHNCETLAPNEFCQVDITFWPMFPGFATADLLMKFSSNEIDFHLEGEAIP